MTLISNVQRWLGQGPSQLHADPDAQLMWRFHRSGDARCLSQLVERLGDDLYHFLLTQSDASLAEDLSQAVWLKVLENKEAYEPGHARFKTWLFTLGRNLLIDEMRRRQRWQSNDLDEDELEQWLFRSQEQQYQNEQLQQRFDHLLLQLPFVQREAFVLQQEGFSLADISQITGAAQETVKSRLRFARRFFHHHLEAAS